MANMEKLIRAGLCKKDNFIYCQCYYFARLFSGTGAAMSGILYQNASTYTAVDIRMSDPKLIPGPWSFGNEFFSPLVFQWPFSCSKARTSEWANSAVRTGTLNYPSFNQFSVRHGETFLCDLIGLLLQVFVLNLQSHINLMGDIVHFWAVTMWVAADIWCVCVCNTF